MTMNIITCLMIVACTGHLAVSGTIDLETEKKILESIKQNAGPNTIIRPAGKNDSGPVIAVTNFYIRKISEINEANMEYRVQLTFRQNWYDGRLAYKDKYPNFGPYVSLLNVEDIWTPDVFFSNEIEGHYHNILQPNTLVRIYPNGDILYSTRISLKLSCPMDLKYFPMDEQTCSIIIASYGYTTEQLIFLWKEVDPVQITKNLHMKDFTLTQFTTDYCTSGTTTGLYTCLKLIMSFSRKLNYYGIRVYIPFSNLVIVSWIPFWLDSRNTIVRILIWVGASIASFILISNVQPITPQVSYTMAIDVWTGVCFTFLLAAIIELAIVSRIVSKEEKDSTDDPKNKSGQDSRFGNILNNTSTSQRIDIISRIAYPVCFLVFNIIYWATFA